MSANIFPMMSRPKDSRIPVPSPLPLRRSGSLRFRNEISDSNHTASGRFEQDSSRNSALLKRGKSFMERGEKNRYGVSATGSKSSNLDSTNSLNRRHSRGSTTPQTACLNRISGLSLSLSTTRLDVPRSPCTSRSSPKTPPIAEDCKTSPCFHRDWDTESVNSISSVGSCEHASVARNGTTFSGRSMKYVFHCNQHSGTSGDEYLTPTQRVQRQVKKLKQLLQQARKGLEEKDSQILKLTKEVVELRLYKAALNSPEDKSSNSSDAITVRENTDEQITPDVDRSLVQNDMTNSYTDSGHFEDYANSPVNSKEKLAFKSRPDSIDRAVSVALGDNTENANLIVEYERRIQELIKTHEEESYQIKQKHNDKVEELLQRITEINKRYWELVPELDLAKEKIKELEIQLEEACQKLSQADESQTTHYLQVYQQHQEAEKQDNLVMEVDKPGPSRISVPELLEELQVTKDELEKIKDVEYASTSNNLQPLLSAKEALSLWVLGARKAMYKQLVEAKNKNKIDPEITLQFLKSAIYYFLTDKENSQGHLKAIESILGFSANEISNIDKAWFS